MTATTTRTLTVTIGAAPDPMLSPNAKPNRYAKTRAVKAARDEAYWETWIETGQFLPGRTWEGIPGDGVIEMEIAVGWPPDRRRLDDDNLIGCLKPTRDGIADALGISDRRFRVISVTQERADDRRGWVRFTLRWEA